MRFAKKILIGILTKTHFSQMHEQTIQVSTTASGSSVCFYPGLFLRPVMSVSAPVIQWSILLGQTENQLRITTWLFSDFCHWFGYIYVIRGAQKTSIDTIWPFCFFGQRPVCTWICFSSHVSMSLCVCVVSIRRLLITSGVIWCDIR